MEVPDVGGSKKKAQAWRAWIVFLDESGISQRPPVRRTWAPRGRTPVLAHPFNWKKLSICSVLAYRWDGSRSRMYFRIVSNSFNEVKLIDFLTNLRRQFRGRSLLLIWDGLPSHRSRLMSEYLQKHERSLTAIRLPPYAPELNPVESVWANITGQELANRCADDLGPMVEAVRKGFDRIHHHKPLARSFLTHAGLSF